MLDDLELFLETVRELASEEDCDFVFSETDTTHNTAIFNLNMDDGEFLVEGRVTYLESVQLDSKTQRTNRQTGYEYPRLALINWTAKGDQDDNNRHSIATTPNDMWVILYNFIP